VEAILQLQVNIQNCSVCFGRCELQFPIRDLGCQGRISDEGIFRNCELNEKMEKDSLGFPPPAPLKGRKKPVPYFFVADEAFP
jgi:hypothetical protein